MMSASELHGWRTAEGHYADGRIWCRVPALLKNSYDPDAQLNYNVDVALNG